ncbi:MAG: hypothetical protein C4325_01675, partial [Blastocatellia bacterium]
KPDSRIFEMVLHRIREIFVPLRIIVGRNAWWPAEKFDEYYEKIKAKGIPVTPILNHDDSPKQVSREVHAGTFIRSFYFQDPDGIIIEIATRGPGFAVDEPPDRLGEQVIQPRLELTRGHRDEA